MTLLALLTLLAAQGASAPACDQAKADQGIQSEMNICAANEYIAADEALNAQWRETAAVMRRLDDYDHDDGRPGYFETLLEAQRAWLAYRDASCRLEGYDARGGSLEPLLASTCLTHLTRLRIDELRDLTRNSLSGESRSEGH